MTMVLLGSVTILFIIGFVSSQKENWSDTHYEVHLRPEDAYTIQTDYLELTTEAPNAEDAEVDSSVESYSIDSENEPRSELYTIFEIALKEIASSDRNINIFWNILQKKQFSMELLEAITEAYNVAMDKDGRSEQLSSEVIDSDEKQNSEDAEYQFFAVDEDATKNVDSSINENEELITVTDSEPDDSDDSSEISDQELSVGLEDDESSNSSAYEESEISNAYMESTTEQPEEAVYVVGDQLYDQAEVVELPEPIQEETNVEEENVHASLNVNEGEEPIQGDTSIEEENVHDLLTNEEPIQENASNEGENQDSLTIDGDKSGAPERDNIVAIENLMKRSGSFEENAENEDLHRCEGCPLQSGSIRGIPGTHFPNYEDIPITSFSCLNRHIPGFYADLETGCQVFHVCWPHRRESFLCPIGTIFNQAILACDFWYSVNCSLSPLFWDKNSDFDVETSTMVDDLLDVSTRQPVPKPPSPPVEDLPPTQEKPSSVTNEEWTRVVKFLPVKSKVIFYPSHVKVKTVSQVEADRIVDNVLGIAGNIAREAAVLIRGIGNVVSESKAKKLQEISRIEPVPKRRLKPVAVKSRFVKTKKVTPTFFDDALPLDISPSTRRAILDNYAKLALSKKY